MEAFKLFSAVFLRAVAVILILVTTVSTKAASVWTGPSYAYTQPAPIPTQASNQDRITPDVWLTRATSKGLFNAFYETNATALSPSNTEWAFGPLTNYATLHFTNWLGWLNGQSPTTLVGQPAVLHLISDDIYLSIQFTAWTAGGSGGFAYERSTPVPISLAVTNAIGGQFSLSYNTDVGFTYVIQTSSNLINWSPLATNTAAGGSLVFSNAMSSMAAQFYRVERLTNF
jgi:hypothetical protein